jgi:predicted membrane channel-forming protein YqfA (hemolysin III family)
MIFLLIAGTNTPVVLLARTGPRWLAVAVYLAVGGIAVLAMPRLFVRLGIAGGLLIVTGGLVSSTGAAMDAWVRHDPVPAVFGYHNVTRAGASAAADGVDAESSMSDTRIPARRPCRCSYGRVRLVADAMKKGAT